MAAISKPPIAPRVSVLMPVFNVEPFVRQALQSLQDQTFTDFEILILNDGSTDKTIDVIEAFVRETSESRIRIIHNDKNMGISKTLNRGLLEARGELLARMDGDDLCLPKRFEMQVNYLDTHPAVDILGTGFKTFGSTIPRIIRNPATHDEVIAALLFDCPATLVMMRRSRLKEFDLQYDSFYDKAEDYEMWTRAGKNLKIENLSEPLVLYRIHQQQISSATQNSQVSKAEAVREKYLLSVGVSLPAHLLRIHHRIARYDFSGFTQEDLKNVLEWKQLMFRELSVGKDIKAEVFNRVIMRRFTQIFYSNRFNFPLSKWFKSNGLVDVKSLRLNERWIPLLKSCRQVFR